MGYNNSWNEQKILINEWQYTIKLMYYLEEEKKAIFCV